MKSFSRLRKGSISEFRSTLRTGRGGLSGQEIAKKDLGVEQVAT